MVVLLSHQDHRARQVKDIQITLLLGTMGKGIPNPVALMIIHNNNAIHSGTVMVGHILEEMVLIIIVMVAGEMIKIVQIKIGMLIEILIGMVAMCSHHQEFPQGL
jgi:hypothetical protein